MYVDTGFLTHCDIVTPRDDIDLVITGSGDGLLSDGTNSLPEPMLNYSIIVVFFPGFDRIIPGLDRFIPVSTDSSLLAFLLLEPSPYSPNAHWSMKCVLLCVLKSFYFILIRINIFILFIIIYLYFPEIFNATDCRLSSAGSDMSQSSVGNSMQEGPSEIAVVQISRTEYITKCYCTMVDQIPQKRMLWPWNQLESHCLHRRPHIWNSRTSGVSRNHGAHEGTPAWTKAKPSSSVRSH